MDVFFLSHEARRVCVIGAVLRRLGRSSALLALAAGLAGMFALPAAAQAAAVHTTANFQVTASRSDVAAAVATEAERVRKEFAEAWFGQPLEDWPERCQVTVDMSTLSMGGATTYTFRGDRVAHWKVQLRGSAESILESVLPHEIAHTVLVSHFRRPIPRWADEGVALGVECGAERRRIRDLTRRTLSAGRLLALADLMRIDEYPHDGDQLRVFYLQGATVTEYLSQAGMPRFIRFLEEGMADGWDPALQSHYGFRDLEELDRHWRTWLAADRPALTFSGSSTLAEIARTFRGGAAGDAEANLAVVVGE